MSGELTDARLGLLKGEDTTNRMMLWKLILGVHSVDANDYVRLVELGPSPSEQAIKRDLLRALAGDSEASLLRDSRIRLLNAHSNAASGSQKCEYKQGMGGAAAALLYVLNEVEAYAAFCALTHSWAPGLYQTGHETVALGCAVADEVLAWADAELHSFLVDTYSTGRAYADLMFYSRVASLYATRGPMHCVARLWDCILGLGAHAVPLLCVAECCLRREELMEAGRDAITRFQNIGGTKGLPKVHTTPATSVSGTHETETATSGSAPATWDWNRLQLDAVETMCALVLQLESSLRGHECDSTAQAVSGTGSGETSAAPAKRELKIALRLHLQERLHQFALHMAGLPPASTDCPDTAHPLTDSASLPGSGATKHRPRKSWSEDDASRCLLASYAPSDSADAASSSCGAVQGSLAVVAHGPASAAARIGMAASSPASGAVSSPPISEPHAAGSLNAGQGSRRTPTSSSHRGLPADSNTAFARRKAYYEGLRARADDSLTGAPARTHGRGSSSGMVPHLGLYDTVSMRTSTSMPGSMLAGLPPPVPPIAAGSRRGMSASGRSRTTTSSGSGAPVLPTTASSLRRTSAVSEASASASGGTEGKPVRAIRGPSQRTYTSASVDPSARKKVPTDEAQDVSRAGVHAPAVPVAVSHGHRHEARPTSGAQGTRLGSAATLVRKIQVTERK